MDDNEKGMKDPAVFDETLIRPGNAEGISPWAELERSDKALRQETAQRKQTDAALRESELRLRKSQEFAGMVGWDWDILENRSRWSGDPTLLLGPSALEIIDIESFLSCLHPRDIPGIREKIQRSIDHEIDYEAEYRVIWPDGSVHWLRSQGNLLRNAEGNFVTVLMDISMPVMDGIETFKRFKEVAPPTPVIMVTAFAVEDMMKDALREGAFGLLRKPIDFEKLFFLIQEAMTDGDLIMVVDDNEDLCINLREILIENGFRVCTAGDGGTAIKRAQEKDFKIIILDLRLPDFSGLETYLAIREFRPSVQVIAVTGYMGEMHAMAREIVSKSVLICLEKPLDINNLIGILNRTLEDMREGRTRKIH